MTIYNQSPNPVLRRSVESAQYLSIRYSERLAEAGIEPSVGSKGDSYDNALAEIIHRRGPWRTKQAVELAMGKPLLMDITEPLVIIGVLLGGMVIPFAELPSVLRAVAQALPSGALADVLHHTLGGVGTRPTTSWLVLGGWAMCTPAVAALTFRWD